MNVPAWHKTIELLYPAVVKMATKIKAPQWLYSLLCTLLCVSRRDFFLKNWTDFIDFVPMMDESIERRGCSALLG